MRLIITFLLTIILFNHTYTQNNWVTAIIPDKEYQPIGKDNRASFLNFYYDLSYVNGKSNRNKDKTYYYKIYNETRSDFANVSLKQQDSYLLISADFKWNEKYPKLNYAIKLSDFEYLGTNSIGNRAYIYSNSKYLAVFYEPSSEIFQLIYFPVKLLTGKTGLLYFDIAHDLDNFKLNGYIRSLE
ncbi:hypothetical protein [Aequorivita sp. KMM 9714]|uniref:hypothetical protein n=1 Tax=Aequorivita sp. KMM 9714 TaxID=2707173 RepID=UPI0013ED7749|nr:hypothetical protein [Aequorivita sp. KMM 9714]NGX84879.1 hypothetical protein [Aequorivita sp. KMM 9714]